LRIGEIEDTTPGKLINTLFQIKVMKRMWSRLYMKKMLIKISKSGRFFSWLVSPSYLKILDLDNLGRREFDIDYN